MEKQYNKIINSYMYAMELYKQCKSDMFVEYKKGSYRGYKMHGGNKRLWFVYNLNQIQSETNYYFSLAKRYGKTNLGVFRV